MIKNERTDVAERQGKSLKSLFTRKIKMSRFFFIEENRTKGEKKKFRLVFSPAHCVVVSLCWLLFFIVIDNRTFFFSGVADRKKKVNLSDKSCTEKHMFRSKNF
jgi:hypothetical protein